MAQQSTSSQHSEAIDGKSSTERLTLHAVALSALPRSGASLAGYAQHIQVLSGHHTPECLMLANAGASPSNDAVVAMLGLARSDPIPI